MPDAPSPAPRAKIRPAGWVVLIVALGLGGYFAWTKLAPLLPVSPVAPPPPSSPTPPENKPEPRAPGGAGLVLPRDLFPAAAPALPAQRAPAVANATLPAMFALELPPAGVKPAPSEVEAIRAIARGEADSAIVSVAALAAVPEAVAAGVQAVWYVGESVADGALFPACDGATLRRAKLGVVPGSLAHFHLLAALAGDALPALATFERDAELERAVNDKVVTGGPARGRGARFLAAAGKPPCLALPRSAFALVVVRHTARPMTAPELAALAALVRHPLPDPEENAAFFDRKRGAPGGFVELFESAGAVWAAVHLIGRPAFAKAAVDRTFLDGAGPAAPGRHPRKDAAKELGFPSWLDR
jgi:hypothetical protein